MEVKVRAPKLDRELVFEADIPETLAGLVDKYGEEVVADGATSAIKIGLQGYVRSMMEAGSTDEKILEAVPTWKPGMKRDSAASLIAKVGKMSDEEKAALAAALGL